MGYLQKGFHVSFQLSVKNSFYKMYIELNFRFVRIIRHSTNQWQYQQMTRPSAKPKYFCPGQKGLFVAERPFLICFASKYELFNLRIFFLFSKTLILSRTILILSSAKKYFVQAEERGNKWQWRNWFDLWLKIRKNALLVNGSFMIKTDKKWEGLQKNH